MFGRVNLLWCWMASNWTDATPRSKFANLFYFFCFHFMLCVHRGRFNSNHTNHSELKPRTKRFKNDKFIANTLLCLYSLNSLVIGESEWVRAPEIDRENEDCVRKRVCECVWKEIERNCIKLQLELVSLRFVQFIHFVWNTWITQTTTNWSVNGKCQELFQFFRKKTSRKSNYTLQCVCVRASEWCVQKFLSKIVCRSSGCRWRCRNRNNNTTISDAFVWSVCSAVIGGICIVDVRIVDCSDNKFDWKQNELQLDGEKPNIHKHKNRKRKNVWRNCLRFFFYFFLLWKKQSAFELIEWFNRQRTVQLQFLCVFFFFHFNVNYWNRISE